MQSIVVQFVVVISMAVSQYGATCTAAADGPIMNTASGQIMGSRAKVPFTSSNYTSFLGIPYAEPPLGALRFAKPLPKKPWEGVRDALTYGPECPQKTANTSETTNEDCLYLNVFVPVDALAKSSQIPVMVWFHGGSFTSGSGSTYIGMKLSTYGEVVVVNLNYRLGLLGFLCTGDESSPGNYGLWDQRLAVQWVKNNIGNFGGDPEQITIFGESAGAMSVSYHALSPVNDRSLFQRVIAGSGAADDSLLMGGETCRATAEAIGGAVGCDTTKSTESLVDCLRTVPSQTFVTLQSQPSVIGETPIGPTLDGEFISDRISNLIQSSNLAQYDLLTGVNSDDGSYFAIDPDGVDAKLFTSQTSLFLDIGYKSKNPEILIDAATFYYTNGVLRYPKPNQKSLMAMAGDSVFFAPTINNLRHHFDASRSSQYNTQRYLYYFSMAFFRGIFIPDGFEEYIDGAPHGLDVAYVFGLVAAVPIPTPGYKLSLSMMKYWSNFAKTGDPNGSDLPTWPRWDPIDEQYIVLDKKISTGQHLLPGRINFWLDYIHRLLEPSDPNVCPLGVPLRSLETQQPAGTKTIRITTERGEALGSVIGSLKRADTAMGGKVVAEFLGIPYSEPPLGRFRFHLARDVSPWEGLLNGRVKPPACPQIPGNDPWMVGSGFVETDEDCLTLNIYSPKTSPAGQKLPVVVYVHHGFGMHGTASVYEATTLSSKSNAVIVVINYRLGALGFLSTEDENAPGNAGLHDILTALGWVQRYIGSFGGDASRVTLAGYGAGASLVHALTASTKSKGLFRQCILMGGSVFNPVMSNTVQMGPAKQAATLAEKLGCPTNTNEEMIQCLQRQPATSLVASTPHQPLSMAFRPVVDGDVLTDAPTKLIRAGKTNEVECIIGTNQHWIDYQVADLLQSDLQSCPNKVELETLIKNTIKMFFHNADLVSQAVLNEYVEDSGNNESVCPHRQQLRRFMQDFLSTVPIMEAAQYHSRGNNTVYLYSFNHDPKYHYSSLPSWTGPSSGDDLQYLFGFPYWPAISYPLKSIPSYSLTDKKTTLEWTRLLSSFIHNGSPGASLSGTEWPSYNAIDGKMMSISTCPDVEPSTIQRNRYQFWTDVVPSIAAISNEPPSKPINPDNCVIDGGLGLKLSAAQANGTIQALFGIMIILVILNVTFVVLYWVLRSRNKNKGGRYISGQEHTFENPSAVEIGSF